MGEFRVQDRQGSISKLCITRSPTSCRLAVTVIRVAWAAISVHERGRSNAEAGSGIPTDLAKLNGSRSPQ